MPFALVLPQWHDQTQPKMAWQSTIANLVQWELVYEKQQRPYNFEGNFFFVLGHCAGDD
jgi:hypothetical protein